MSGLPKILVDTSTLEAMCKTTYAEVVFEHLPLWATDVCLEEIRRNQSSTSDYRRKRALKKVLKLRAEHGAPERVMSDVQYRPYVTDQGEESILSVLETDALSGIQYVLLFDFDATETLSQTVAGEGIEVNTPGRAFELAWSGGFLSEPDYHTALREMADAEGWAGEALVEDLPQTKYEDVF
jgi:hypothetical protein